MNQIEGEEGLYSESNRGRGRGEGGKSEGEVGEERGREVPLGIAVELLINLCSENVPGIRLISLQTFQCS